MLKKRVDITGKEHCELRALLIGDRGAVQFVMSAYRLNGKLQYLPTDVGYHSRTETEYGTHFTECPYLEKNECWYDDSGLHADDLYNSARFWSEPARRIWLELEKYYSSRFYVDDLANDDKDADDKINQFFWHNPTVVEEKKDD